jgi:hypothetical protein
MVLLCPPEASILLETLDFLEKQKSRGLGLALDLLHQTFDEFGEGYVLTEGEARWVGAEILAIVERIEEIACQVLAGRPLRELPPAQILFLEEEIRKLLAHHGIERASKSG